jgi:hypothetical protein
MVYFVLKLVGAAVSGILGIVAVLSDFKDKKTGRLTLAGKINLAGLLTDRWAGQNFRNSHAVFVVRNPMGQNGRLAVGAAQPFIKSGDILNHIEAILISAAEPPHNRQGGRFGDDVEQYLQFRDDDALGPNTESMVKELWKQGHGKQARGHA